MDFNDNSNKRYEHLLKSELEFFKINYTEIQYRKTQEFIGLIMLFNEYFTDKSKLQALATSQKEKQKFNKSLLDLGNKLFFFASDKTINKYLEMRKDQYLLNMQN